VLGAIVLIVWAFVANAILGLRPSIDMRRVANERHVYDVLRENVAAPGGYTVNPPLNQSGEFMPGQPVFSVRYSGVGHDAAGRMLILGLVIAFIASTIAAGLLSVASDRIMSSYCRRVLFFAAIGLLFAFFSDLAQFGIGGYPLRSALLLAGNYLVSWTLVGLVVARWMRPRPHQVGTV
jgi:ABC-type Na+ efflux pump permease subunit